MYIRLTGFSVSFYYIELVNIELVFILCTVYSIFHTVHLKMENDEKNHKNKIQQQNNWSDNERKIKNI